MSRLRRLAMEVQDIAANLRFDGKKGATDKSASPIGVDGDSTLGEVISEYLTQVCESAFGRRSVIERGAGSIGLEIEVYNPEEPSEYEYYQANVGLNNHGALTVDVTGMSSKLKGKKGRVLTLTLAELMSMDKDTLQQKIESALRGRAYATQPDSPSLEVPLP
jgi:hypothetical protein